MKKIFVLVLSISLLTVFGQKKELTLEKSILEAWGELAPERVKGLQWIPKTENYCFLDGDVLVKSSPTSTEKIQITSLETINNSLDKDKQLSRFPRITWLNKEDFYFHSKNNYYECNIKTNFLKTYSLDEKAQNLDIDKNTFNIAYTVKNNLFIKKTTGSVEQISNEENTEILFGQAVHRSEFGIRKGIFWSPKGNKLAFYRKDETMVSNYPLVDMTSRVATLKNIKYFMAGMKSHHVTLGIYDLSSKKTIFIKTGEPKEQYLTAVSWSPNEEFVFIGVLNRDQNHLKMNKYDAKTGEFIKTLFEEKDEQFVEPEHSLVFIPNDTEKFLWFSSKENYKQLYLYNTEGKQLKKVTKGNWNVTHLLGFDNENNIYFQAATNFGLERQIFKTTLKGKQTQITQKKGTHIASFNKKGMILDYCSNINTPREISIINSDKKVLKTLLKSKDPLAEYAYARPELVKLSTKEGLQLNARMIKPSHFDATKKYPVLVYVYGGSHAQLVRNSWLAGASTWMYHLAEKGYIVFTLDNRGSHNRSMDFEQATHRNLSDKEIEDQLTGVDYLKTLPYVNSEKMAIHGWSFGGFMTTSMMLKKPNVFKVGVAGGPVIDWNYYEIMYGERYMDTPEQNPEGYKNADVSNFVEDLEGKLLIIHGQVDDVVVPQHSMKLLKASVDKQVQIDFFTYPGHPHNVQGKDRVHLMKKVIDYIEINL